MLCPLWARIALFTLFIRRADRLAFVSGSLSASGYSIICGVGVSMSRNVFRAYILHVVFPFQPHICGGICEGGFPICSVERRMVVKRSLQGRVVFIRVSSLKDEARTVRLANMG